MNEVIAPKSIVNKLKQVATEFLTKMQEGNYDVVWHHMITLEAARFFSTAIFPIHAYQEGKIDKFLEPISHDLFSSLVDLYAYDIQMGITQIRSEIFEGLSAALKQEGWYDVSLEDSGVVVGEAAAILFVQWTPSTALVMPFIKQGDNYQIDLEGLLLLFMRNKLAYSLYSIGTKAFDIGQQKSAIAYFELAASLSQPLSRIKPLLFDHVLLKQLFSEDYRQELLNEENYILLARHQVLVLLSGPKFSSERVNMAEFLGNTFKGYTEIPNMELNQKDLDKLYTLNDRDLRNAIANILNGVDLVVAKREAKKSHGPYEISDMELVVQHNERHRLSMPFKSALEIREDHVPVKFAYQIIRPFLQFPEGIVVFITAKPCSQLLHNYIKAANDILGLLIEVIEYEELGKLLKVNNLLN